MKEKFKKLLSVVSALAVTIAVLPITELPAIAEDEMAEVTNEPADFSLVEDDSATEEVISDSDIVVSTFDAPMIMTAQTGITKEEWIHDLVTVFDMSIEDDSTIESHFTDIADSPYAYDIDLAANYGVFDIESESFNPDDLVTREFAAHTANYCFGYLDDSTTVTFADSDDIYYEYDAVVSVQKGWFKPSSGKFLPNAVLTEKEAENILNDAKSSLESVMIDKNAEHTINYTNSVVQLDDSVNASYFNGTVTVKGTSVSVKKGNTFCVNIDGMDKLYKANNVTKDAEGNTIIAVTDASLKDAISAIDIQGYGDVDYSNAMFYGTSSSSDKVKLLQYKPNINGVQSQLVKAVNIKNDTISIDEEIDMGGASIKLSGTIKNIKPEYKLDYDGINVNSFYLNVDADADISCTLSGNLIKETSSKEVNLAKVPVALGGPMSANIVISVSVSVSGEITMKYSWDINSGVSYTKAGGWRVTKDFKKKGFSLTASGSEKVAIKAALNAEVFGCKLGEIYVMGGESGKFTNTPRNNGAVFCDNLKVYAFAEAGASLNLFDIVKFSQSYEFIDYNNSPLRYNKHWENGVEVAECSFDKSTTSTTSKRTANKASSYSNYSTYGLEYEGIITLANSADSDDYTPYQTWTESKTLSGNVTVNGDLYLKNDVNLNGYTLTVNGNLIQASGELKIGDGKLNVGGNYEIYSDGYIYMYGTGGKVNVAKDFIMKSNAECKSSNTGYDNTNHFIRGALFIGGNFYQYNSGTQTKNFIQGGTKIEFVGSGVHEIHFDSINSYFTDISTTDGAKLKFTGKMHGFQLNNDMTFVGDTTLNAGTLHLCANHLIIEGDFTQNGTVNLWSGILDIKGNYNLNGSLYNNGESQAMVNVDKQFEMNSGSLDLDDIKLDISYNLIQASGELKISDGELNVGGNYEISSDGYIYMYGTGGKVNVAKDFIMKSNAECKSSNTGYDNTSHLIRGALLISGNFYQYNSGTQTKNFIQGGTKIEFVGSGVHEIHFDSINSYFTDISTTDGAKLKFTGKMHGFQLNNDMTFVGDTTLNAGSLHLCANHLIIEGDFTQNGTVNLWSGILDIKGNYNLNGSLYNNGESQAMVNVDKQFEMNSGSLDLDDIKMDISYNLIQASGELKISDGKLNVGGNYEISSDGYIYMYGTGGKVNVAKDFIMKSNAECQSSNTGYDNTNHLIRGALLIGGNFYQYNSGTQTKNFIQGGTKIEFVGSGVHEIHSQSSNTKMSDIVLTNGASVSFNGKLNGFSAINSCTFSSSDTTVANVSGNTVQSVSAGYTTLKIDDKPSIELTVESVVTGDANGDGKFTVADAVILQKWLLAVPHVRLSNWEACDLCKDGRIDVFDLCLLKRKLINS